MSSGQPDYISPDGEVFDCATCGSCCSFFFWTVGLLKGEEKNVPARSRRMLPVFNPDTGTREEVEVMKTTSRGACFEWVGLLGERSECRIYENRPYTCRQFTPGNPGCIKARRHHGIGGDREGHVSLRLGFASAKNIELYTENVELFGQQSPELARALLATSTFIPDEDKTTES